MATSPILGDLQGQLNDLDHQILLRQKILSGQGGDVPGWNSNHPPSNPKTVAKMQQEIQQLQMQKAQLQASAQIPNLENIAQQGSNLYNQQSDYLAKVLPQIESLVPTLNQLASEQRGLAGLQKGLIGKQSDLADSLKQYADTSLQNRLHYAGDVGKLAEQYSSMAPGELTPAAQAQLENDLESISGAYGKARETGLRTLGYSGSSAPAGGLASLLNTSARDAAQAETQARRNAVINSEGQRMQGAGMEASLAQLFDPNAASSAAQSGYNSASGTATQASNTYGSSGNTSLATMNPAQFGLSGYSTLGQMLGNNAGLYGDIVSATNPVAQQGENLSNLWSQYGQQYQKTSPWGSILKGVGTLAGIAAAPFTGGASLALSGASGGLDLSGLAGLFKKKQTNGFGNIEV